MKNKLLKNLAIILCLTFCLTGCKDKEAPVNSTESCVVEDSENLTTEIVNTEDIIDSGDTENVENSEVVTGTILEENGHLKQSFELTIKRIFKTGLIFSENTPTSKALAP